MAEPLSSLVDARPISDLAQSVPYNLSSITGPPPKKGGRGPGMIGSMLGIFAGPYAAANLAKAGHPEPQQALEIAKKMEADGKSPDEIYKATSDFLSRTPFAGVAKTKDGALRFEIPDNDMRIKNPSASRLDEAIDHPLFFAAYPFMRDRSVNLSSGTSSGGEFRAATGAVEVSPSDKKSLLSILSHELTHAAQAFEGDLFHVDRPDTSHGMTNAQKKQYDEYIKNYYRNPSEAEAEESSKRLLLTPEQRRAGPPAYSSPAGIKTLFEPGAKHPNEYWMRGLNAEEEWEKSNPMIPLPPLENKN